MSIFSFWRRKQVPLEARAQKSLPQNSSPVSNAKPIQKSNASRLDIRRYFHNERGFQCYTTWFSYWGGWISAGHCVTEAAGHTPSFVTDDCEDWPDGLDAALAGCTLPAQRPHPPQIGQAVILKGFPAGSRVMEIRKATVYHQRSPGQWIAHIKDPDEPVVTGMSGGPVIDIQTGQPIGILITRNSPADLNNDRDPDESADFIALSDVWTALKQR